MGPQDPRFTLHDVSVQKLPPTQANPRKAFRGRTLNKPNVGSAGAVVPMWRRLGYPSLTYRRYRGR